MRLWRCFLYLSCCIMGKGAIMSQTHSTSGVWTQNTAGWRGRYDHDFPMRGNKYTVVPSCRAIHSAMSEWLLFSTNSAIFQAILWPEQVNFNEMMEEVRFVLDQHVYLNFYSVTHWNNRPRIDMSPHLDTLLWFNKYQFYNLWFDPIITTTMPFILLWKSCLIKWVASFKGDNLVVHVFHYLSDLKGVEFLLGVVF